MGCLHPLCGAGCGLQGRGSGAADHEMTASRNGGRRAELNTVCARREVSMASTARGRRGAGHAGHAGRRSTGITRTTRAVRLGRGSPRRVRVGGLPRAAVAGFGALLVGHVQLQRVGKAHLTARVVVPENDTLVTHGSDRLLGFTTEGEPHKAHPLGYTLRVCEHHGGVGGVRARCGHRTTPTGQHFAIENAAVSGAHPLEVFAGDPRQQVSNVNISPSTTFRARRRNGDLLEQQHEKQPQDQGGQRKQTLRRFEIPPILWR